MRRVCLLLLCCLVFLSGCGNSDDSEITTEETEETLENENEQEELSETEVETADYEEELSFLDELKTVLDESVAEKAYDILANQIGFTSLEFDGAMDGTSNYEIWVDGTYAVLTASDDVYRIFIPSSSYTFYEDGEVKMTAQEFSDKTIDQYDRSAYYIIAKDVVQSSLKNPSSADFPSLSSGDVAMQKNGDIVAVQSYVDASNSFGATVRTEWTVEFQVLDLDMFSYNLLYIRIGDDSSGEWVELE